MACFVLKLKTDQTRPPSCLFNKINSGPVQPPPPPPSLSPSTTKAGDTEPPPAPPGGLIVVRDVPLSRARIICQFCGQESWEFYLDRTSERSYLKIQNRDVSQPGSLYYIAVSWLTCRNWISFSTAKTVFLLRWYFSTFIKLSWLIPQNWPLPCNIRSLPPKTMEV